MKKLVNPDLRPTTFGFTGVSAATKTSFYVDDSCGMATQKGLINTANGVAFTVNNGFSADNVKRFLQTYALLISETRMKVQNEDDLVNPLTLIRTGLDGQSENEIIPTDDATTPFANNPNLIVIKRPWVYTATTAIKVTSFDGANRNYVYTFTVKTIIPYGQLDAFLAENPITY